jgi:hypothetical protein
MGINVNTVYTTVLSILNKEQRGYLTPYEYNLLASQVQLGVFESFFEDYNQYLRMPKTSEEYASRIEHIRDEYQIFEKYESASTNTTPSNVYGYPTDLHRLGTAFYNGVKGSPRIQLVSQREFRQLNMSPLTQPSETFPIATFKDNKLTVYPQITNPPAATSVNDVKFSYIRKPVDPRWGYYVGSLGQYIYDSRTFGTNKLIIGKTFTVPSFSGGTTATAGTYTGIATTTSGSGSGCKLDITVAGSGTVTLSNANTTITISTLDNSTDYAVGNTLTLAGGSFGSLNNAITTRAITADDLMTKTNTTQGSIDYEVDDAQRSTITMEILKYSGVIVKDPGVVNAAYKELAEDEANEKR